MTLRDKVEELGYSPLDKMKIFSNTIERLIELVTYFDSWKVINETDVVNGIEVLVVSKHMIKTSIAIDESGDDSYR